MEDTTPTGMPVPEREYRLGHWAIQELENDNGFAFVTPEGYRFIFKTVRDALNFIIEYQYEGVYHSTKHGDKHYSDGYDISVWSPDPWINKDWNHGDIVCRKQDITEVILDYVYAKWMKNS